ncbi:MAG: EutN/CcmL family microcompartment protein [Christensenella sp.]
MQLAKIIGYANSITKSDDLYGAELLVAVSIDIATMRETGKLFLAADKLGAKQGQFVICAAESVYGQTDTVIDMVIAIPEMLNINGEERLRQIVEQQNMNFSDDIDDGAVSNLTEEFRALHREVDEPTEKQAVVSTTSKVPYEEYAKYLTTDFEPVDAQNSVYAVQDNEHLTEEKKQNFARVGLRSEKKK